MYEQSTHTCSWSRRARLRTAFLQSRASSSEAAVAIARPSQAPPSRTTRSEKAPRQRVVRRAEAGTRRDSYQPLRPPGEGKTSAILSLQDTVGALMRSRWIQLRMGVLSVRVKGERPPSALPSPKVHFDSACAESGASSPARCKKASWLIWRL